MLQGKLYRPFLGEVGYPIKRDQFFVLSMVNRTPCEDHGLGAWRMRWRRRIEAGAMDECYDGRGVWLGEWGGCWTGYLIGLDLE